MKKVKLSLATMLLVGSCSAINADSLIDAFKNGTTSGDISLAYEVRNQDKETSTYYSDTEYAVSSIGLYYKTASYKNFSLNIGMRAFTSIFEDDKDFDTGHGKGDSTERFYDYDGHSLLTDTYLAYDIDKVSIKIGRQKLYEMGLTHLFDGITVRTTPLENMNFDLIYVEGRGRADIKNIRPVEDINENKGLYKVALAYKFNENFKAKAYYFDAPDAYDMTGGRINFDTKFKEVKTGLQIQYIEASKDDLPNKDEELSEIKAYATYAGYTTTLGYYETGKDSDLYGAIAKTGETVVPFEEGDPSYDADAKTTYLQVSKSFGKTNVTALYGLMEHGKYDSDELDIWVGYNFNKNIAFTLGYTRMNMDEDSSYTDLDQLNATISYKF